MQKRWWLSITLIVALVILVLFGMRTNPDQLQEVNTVPMGVETAAPVASDPFAAVLQRGSSSPTPKPLPSHPSGHDPFKAFLEKQTVSPFGAEAPPKQ